MGWNALANGPFKNKYRGSLLLIAIVTMGILSLLYLGMAESYRTSTLFFQRTKEYYQIQIMKELFLNEFLNLPENQRLESGEVQYNVGKVAFTYQAPNLNLTIQSLHHKIKVSPKISDENKGTSSTSSESIEKTSRYPAIEGKQIEKETDTAQTSATSAQIKSNTRIKIAN